MKAILLVLLVTVLALIIGSIAFAQDAPPIQPIMPTGIVTPVDTMGPRGTRVPMKDENSRLKNVYLPLIMVR